MGPLKTLRVNELKVGRFKLFFFFFIVEKHQNSLSPLWLIHIQNCSKGNQNVSLIKPVNVCEKTIKQ